MHLLFNLVLSKLYCLSLLTSLNSRHVWLTAAPTVTPHGLQSRPDPRASWTPTWVGAGTPAMARANQWTPPEAILSVEEHTNVNDDVKDTNLDASSDIEAGLRELDTSMSIVGDVGHFA